MSGKFQVHRIPSEFIRDLESQTRRELKSRLNAFSLKVKGDVFDLSFTFKNGQKFWVILDPKLFGFWWGIPKNSLEKEMRKMIASVLSSADRGYHRNHDN